MTGLTITLGGRKLMFATTGEVADVKDAGPVTVGAWRSEAAEADNQIRYTLAGAEQKPLKATYSFTTGNQLELALTGDSGKAVSSTLQGRIEVLRDHNLGYFLVRDDGSDTGVKLTLYVSEFKIVETTNNLQLVLAGGGLPEITGASGPQSLEAERNTLPKFKAADLLTFEAFTVNPLAGGGTLELPADLVFAGSFDLAGDKLVFLSEVELGTRNTVNIGFAGRVGAVTGGFVYFSNGTSTEIALNIRGQHVFKSASGETDLTWEASLGFSNKTFKAAVDVDLQRTTAKGGLLDLHGKLRLESAAGKPPVFDLNLRASYTFQKMGMQNILVFSAHVSGGTQPSYDLMLEGTFVYSNKTLKFLIQYTNAAGAQAIHAEIGVQGQSDNITAQLALVLDLDGKKGTNLKFQASFTMRMRFAGGIRVKDPAKPLAAAASV
jgi:hypothetical protein